MEGTRSLTSSVRSGQNFLLIPSATFGLSHAISINRWANNCFFSFSTALSAW